MSGATVTARERLEHARAKLKAASVRIEETRLAKLAADTAFQEAIEADARGDVPYSDADRARGRDERLRLAQALDDAIAEFEACERVCKDLEVGAAAERAGELVSSMDGVGQQAIEGFLEFTTAVNGAIERYEALLTLYGEHRALGQQHAKALEKGFPDGRRPPQAPQAFPVALDRLAADVTARLAFFNRRTGPVEPLGFLADDRARIDLVNARNREHDKQ